jgi:predicted nucleic acid-binding protein
MIVVVADTSPLNYLLRIGCERLLPELYGKVFIPPAVLRELRDPGTPEIVRAFLYRAPEWIVLAGAMQPIADRVLAELDPGEREAIQLALEKSADLVLMDERTGVRVARERGLRVTGTLGVLLQASMRDLTEIEPALTRLQATDFRCTPNLIARVRQLARLPGL